MNRYWRTIPFPPLTCGRWRWRRAKLCSLKFSQVPDEAPSPWLHKLYERFQKRWAIGAGSALHCNQDRAEHGNCPFRGHYIGHLLIPLSSISKRIDAWWISILSSCSNIPPLMGPDEWFWKLRMQTLVANAPALPSVATGFVVGKKLASHCNQP